MKIGDKLQFLRKLKGYTQEDLADKLNMERRSYANLENNTTKIDIHRIAQIAKIYGIELEELLNFDKDKAFDKCFNKNTDSLFSIKEFESNSSVKDQEFFIQQIQVLVNSFNDERKIFLEAIINLRNTIEGTMK